MHKNHHASLEGFPLYLLIVAIIASITIATVWGLAIPWSKQQTENDLKNEIEHVISTAKNVYNGGVNSSQGVSVEFRNGLFVSIEYIKFGEALSKIESQWIKYKLGGESEKNIIIDEKSGIRMTNSNKNGALQVGSGSYSLFFVHKKDSNIGDYVEISIK